MTRTDSPLVKLAQPFVRSPEYTRPISRYLPGADLVDIAVVAELDRSSIALGSADWKCSAVFATGSPAAGVLISARLCDGKLQPGVIPSNKRPLMLVFDLRRRLSQRCWQIALSRRGDRRSVPALAAERLIKDVALALPGNTLPTGAILVVLIAILGPISGAHFNPAVSIVFALRRELSWRDAALYVSSNYRRHVSVLSSRTGCLHCPCWMPR